MCRSTRRTTTFSFSLSFLVLHLLFLTTECFPHQYKPIHSSKSTLHVRKSLEGYPISHSVPELEVRDLASEEILKRQNAGYWYENIAHGTPSFGAAGYQVFRNVKDYGAKGDGSTDDTEAINRAITDGDRCGQACGSSTTTPAVVYFPAGTYIVSKPLIQYYNTQFVGNPNSVPILKAAPTFEGIAVIDSNVYIPQASGAQWYIPQSNFYRQIRNFVIDLSGCPNVTPDGFAPTGIHWQVAQATSLQNIKFIMSQAAGTTHIGVFMENGSGGYLGDLTFIGGAIGMRCGSQQFTSRNLNFQFCSTAIEMIWDWGWTWKGLNIANSWIGINITALSSTTALHRQGVAAITILDSVMTNVPIGILTSGTTNTMLENLQLNNVPIAIGYSGGPTVLQGGDILIDNYGDGNNFVLTESTMSSGVLRGPYGTSAKSKASSSLRDSSGWFARSKPQYESVAPGGFMNVKDAGARGDGVTDDTVAIQTALNTAGSNQILYFPHGSYIVTDTIKINPGARIVGEAWSEIMGTGSNFEDISNPRVMIQVGTAGQTGVIEISDMIFTTSGATAGAILMEWNIAESSQGSAAMWDAHFRVGGAAGTDLQYKDCPREEAAVNTKCIAATTLMHVTSSASGYFENVWVWVADHDLDIPSQDQVSIYAARCLLIESTKPVWLWGTGSEHCTFYQYHFYKAQNIFAATLQTETPYYQPEPKAPAPFTGAYALESDPTFSYCDPASTTCALAWGLEIIGSSNIMIYGAGFYSWFSWYSQVCLAAETCQERIARVFDSTNIFIANLYTKGSSSMIQGAQSQDILAIDNIDGFLGTIVGWSGFDLPGKLDTPTSVIPLPAWIWDVPNPTVYCHIPCTIAPPPTPILPIQPPPFTATISGSPVVVTPPAITNPGLDIIPLPVVQSPTDTVVPVIVPTPVIKVPPIAPPENIPGGPLPILPPPIPMPIPLPPPPFACLQFCGPPFPPILPPIVIMDGPPLPVGAPPPPIAADPDDPDDTEEDEEEELGCIAANPLNFGSGDGNTPWPTTSDVPTWGITAPSGSNCDWTGSVTHLENTLNIAVASGSTSFSFNAFEIMNVGSAYGISMSGATMQVYAPGVTGWSTKNTPSSPGGTSNRNFITLDVPRNPLATEILVTGRLSQNVPQVQVRIIFEASTSCGGKGIADPEGSSGGSGGDGGDGGDGGSTSGDLLGEYPTRLDGTIECSGSRSDGAGTRNMRDCLFTPGSVIVQGQRLSVDQIISSENVNGNCLRYGETKNAEGVITNTWCVVYQESGCAFVISDKATSFGSCFPGHSIIGGQVFYDFARLSANQCPGTGISAMAAGPFQPCNWAAQTLCLTNPAHPEICGVN